MKLSVKDRFLLLSVLPHQGDFTALKIVRTLREDLSFSEEEHALLQIRQQGESVVWKQDVEQAKEIEVGTKAMGIIGESLVKLDKEKRLLLDHMDLYERFVAKE
jgi:hypothetical protein